MPGHYVRLYELNFDGAPPAPEAHWPDQQPLYLGEGTFDEKLNHWLTLVQRGEVLNAYRVFLGLEEERPNREKLLAHLMFAGVPDIAVGPRWYSSCEMGCIVTRDLLDGRDEECLRNDRPLTRAERQELVESILSG